MAVSWTIVRRHGVDWALPSASELKVEAHADQLHVTLERFRLVVDDVVAVNAKLRPRTTGLLGRLWSLDAVALAVHGGRPVVVVDVQSPPQVLLAGQDVEESGGCDA